MYLEMASNSERLLSSYQERQTVDSTSFLPA